MFLYPLFLFGSLAAGIPLLIHMIHRQRAQEVYWPSLRFLIASDRKTSRRRRVQDLLLLALRMGLLVLLAIALARPFLSGSLGLGQREISAVIVLDTSYSMAAVHNGVSRMQQAQKAALEVLDALPRGSEAAVLYSEGGTPAGATRLSNDRAAWHDAVRDAGPSDGGGALPARVLQGLRQLAEAQSSARELYIVSDMQAGNFRLDEQELARFPLDRIALVLVDCSRPTDNVALTDVKLRAKARVVGLPVTIEGHLSNGVNARRETVVSLFVDDTKRAQQRVSLPPGGQATVQFTHTFSDVGTHTGFLQLEHDGLAPDNVRHFLWEVRNSVDVLVVQDERSAVAQADPAFYLIRALDPFARWSNANAAASPDAHATPAATPHGATRLQVTRLLTEQFKQVDLDGFAAVFLVGVAAPSPDMGGRLRAFVAAGGGLIIFPGDGCSASAYERAFGADGPTALLPAPLAAPQGTPMPAGSTTADDGTKWSVRGGDIAFEHPVLQPFASLSRTLFTQIRAWRRVPLRIPAGSPGEALLRLEDERAPTALLASRAYGGPNAASRPGAVYLFGVSADPRWSNLPVRNVFLPLVHTMVYTLTYRDDMRGRLAIGAPLPQDAWRVAEAATSADAPTSAPVLRMHLPDERTMRIERSRTEPFRLMQRGIYRYGPDQEDARLRHALCVNPPAEESDLRPLADHDLAERVAQQWDPPGDARFAAVLAVQEPGRIAARVERIRSGLQLWNYALIVLLVLLLVECFMANRVVPAVAREHQVAVITPSGRGA